MAHLVILFILAKVLPKAFLPSLHHRRVLLIPESLRPDLLPPMDPNRKDKRFIFQVLFPVALRI
jgi:hypothetical protein